MSKFNLCRNNLIMNKVIMYFNMFGGNMEDRIFSNDHTTLIFLT
jgi:hypothetical protein